MIYSNLEQVKESISKYTDYQKMMSVMTEEVTSFCETFEDDPTRISRWGHHYFCKKDGGLLIYDRKKPKAHVCSICNTVYSNDLLDGVWVYMYRNEAIVQALKAAFIFKVTDDSKYLEYVRKIIRFYSEHYLSFQLHNKEGHSYDSLEDMHWGCGRIMPQGLNESLFIIRMTNALELVKEDLDVETLSLVGKMYQNAFELIKPQVDKIHNIPCWYNSAIGVMGLFTQNSEMLDYAFEGPFNIRRQLREGVTKDNFWYEGSIHYNFFTMEGVTNLALFCQLYGYDFGAEKDILENMFEAAYDYAFDNHQFPNPNDGWPNINLKSYSYIYAIAAKLFGENSAVRNIFRSIIQGDHERGEFPLSKPYYYMNRIPLEQLILVPEIVDETVEVIETQSKLYQSSYNGILRNKSGINVFCKYGHNGPSHAHPDKMTIEVNMNNVCLTRDLSNSGYGNVLCNEWHRMTVSHNTVVVNGVNHESVGPGIVNSFSNDAMDVGAENVYEGVDFRRSIQLKPYGFEDCFYIQSSKMNHYDCFFHVEGSLLTELDFKQASLYYDSNGYQHIKEIKRAQLEDEQITLRWRIGKLIVQSDIDMKGKTLYIAKTPDNPVTKHRTTMIIAMDGTNVDYQVSWKVVEEI